MKTLLTVILIAAAISACNNQTSQSPVSTTSESQRMEALVDSFITTHDSSLMQHFDSASLMKLDPATRLRIVEKLSKNASSEILKAFSLMEESFGSSKTNIDNKSNAIMKLIEASGNEAVYKKAITTRSTAAAFITYLDAATPQLHEANMTAANELQKTINKTRTEMLSVIGDKSKRIDLDIESDFRADDMESDGVKKNWAEAFFKNAPLAGRTAVIAKLKADCSSLEALILKALAETI